MVLNLTHAALRVQRKLDNGKVVHLVGALGDSLASILGLARKGKGLGEAESAVGAHLTGHLDGSTFGGGFASGLSLGDNLYRVKGRREQIIRMDGKG